MQRNSGLAGSIPNGLSLLLRGGRIAAIGVLIVSLTDSGMAQEKKSGASTSASPQTLTTRLTNWPIKITYYNSPEGKESPAVILLHDRGGNRQIWTPVAEKLQEEGYAVVAVDLRGHGDSTGAAVEVTEEPATKGKSSDVQDLRPDVFKFMLNDDMEAVKSFLLEEHHKQNLNVRKTAVVAIGMSAPIAMNFAANDWVKKPYNDGPTLQSSTPRGQDIRALVLISPEASLPGLTTTRAAKLLRDPSLNVSLLLLAGVEDSDVKKNAERVYRSMANSDANKVRMEFRELQTKLNGIDLLSRRLVGPTTKLIVDFLDKHLASLEDRWQERKSRLER